MSRETVGLINRRLKDYYGSEGELPNWRVVFSPDQYEMRHATFEDRTEEGLFIRRVTETRRVPKYSYFDSKWILEALREIPFVNLAEVRGVKLSYECLYAFPYHSGKPLVPIWPAVKLLIDTVHERVGITGPRYLDPMDDPKIASEVKEARLRELEEELYGNETDVGDALAYKEAVGYTGPQRITSRENNDV